MVHTTHYYWLVSAPCKVADAEEIYLFYSFSKFAVHTRPSWGGANLYETVSAESCSLFIQLRHRTPSSPICLSDVIRTPFALSPVFLLSSGGKSIVLVKEKAPSRSGFPLSMHVVLKTRHVNPISTHVDLSSTYVVQTYLPLVHNFYPYVEQQPNIGR